MARQLRLPLTRATSHARDAFVVSPANREALRLIDSWPAWPGGVLALAGPPGVGKSHMASIWAEKAGAARAEPGAPLASGPILVEEAEQWDDESLFHLINRAPVEGGLLLTARKAPLEWASSLPDLRSRLNALTVAEIGEPDDELLEQVILKLFRERSIRPADDVLPYLLRRIERSVPAARDLVALIDETADAERRPVTRVLVRQILEMSGGTLDLFE